MIINKDAGVNELTREAVEYMNRAAYTKEQLATYDKWKLDVMTERGAINDARKEGKMEGVLEIALKMLEKGMSMEDITVMTGLSKQQIEQIQITK